MMKWAALAVLSLGILAGCASTEVTAEQDKKNQEQFSKENWEKEMIKQGRGAELEEMKKAEAARNTGGEQGQ